ncbi:MAG: hypothetical protein ACJ79L_09485 [Anaeromyxobacteraceae bacterium]
MSARTTRPFTRAAVLNPAAGDHRITSDPRELAAARAAGERTLAAYPYFTRRYGESGRAFATSDGAWIATLASEDDERATEQLLWLGRVLASRGMPRVLLEVHLRTLARELRRAVPARARAYAQLDRAAETLAAARRAHVDDAALAAISRRFDADAGAPWASRLPHSGALLASAVADERDGIGNAVASLEPWFTDGERFPPRFAAAVKTALAAARAAAEARAAPGRRPR